jgi:hypothetical protein
MQNQASANVGCRLVAEYLDEGEATEGITAHPGEPVRPRVVAHYLDSGPTEEGPRAFTVVMDGGEIATVRGHGLEVLQPNQPGGPSHYAVLEHQAGGKVIVALFRTDQVRGIFSGNMSQGRKGA